MKELLNDINEIIKKYPKRQENILAVLQDVQAVKNYIPEEAISAIAKAFSVPMSQVYSLATFYRAFSLEPKGKCIIKVCMGTACHVRGAPRILEEISRFLNIQPGQTTKDGRFTLETVNCLGACALGPLVVVGKDYFGKVIPSQIHKILKKYHE